ERTFRRKKDAEELSCGFEDFVFAGEDCGWSKIQKINDLNQSKKANIRILNEADLNYLIKKYGI
ncbi:hypothetical protein DXD65_20805, partial [Bacteroides sp. 4_1_36]